MNKLIILSITFFLAFPAFSQEVPLQVRDSILKEADILYKSEQASWYGTDIFMQEYKGNKNNITGYFSYSMGDDQVCVFYDNAETPNIIGTIKFPQKGDVLYDSAQRSFSALEKEYYHLRIAAYAEINNDTTLFRSYKGTNLNLIPIIDDTSRRVYVITGTAKPDVVFLGNDYLLYYTINNKLISKKAIHQGLIPVSYSDPGAKDEMGAVHNHLPETGHFITATDICTIRLYQKIAKWKQHMVISEKYMSIWNCESNHLLIVPTHR